MNVAAATNRSLFTSHRLNKFGVALQPVKISATLRRHGRFLWLPVPSRYAGDEA